MARRVLYGNLGFLGWRQGKKLATGRKGVCRQRRINAMTFEIEKPSLAAGRTNGRPDRLPVGRVAGAKAAKVDKGKRAVHCV